MPLAPCWTGILVATMALAPPMPAARAADPRFEVKVTRNGAVVASYWARRAEGNLDGGHLSLELSSPDNRHVLVLEVDRAARGQFAVVRQFEPGKATIRFLSDVAAFVGPQRGAVTLTEFSPTRCSGTFSGSGSDAAGNTYTYEGSFTELTVHRAE